MIFQIEAEYGRCHDGVEAQVLLAVGGLGANSVHKHSGGNDHVDAARSYPGMSIELQVQPGEGHLTAAPLNLSRAMHSFWPVPI